MTDTAGTEKTRTNAYLTDCVPISAVGLCLVANQLQYILIFLDWTHSPACMFLLFYQLNPACLLVSAALVGKISTVFKTCVQLEKRTPCIMHGHEAVQIKLQVRRAFW